MKKINQAYKERDLKKRPVSKAMTIVSVKQSSDDIANQIANSNVQITYVPAKGHKQKLVAKAKQKATPKMHYSKFIKQQPSKGK